MRSLRNLAICSALPLILATVVWAALPPADYDGWKWTNGTRWDVSSRHAGWPGWYAVPANLKDTDSALLTLDGVTPRLKTQGEIDAAALIQTRSTARSRMLSAVSELLASQEIQTRLIAAGKDTTKIAARIAAIDSNIATALGNHPDAP